MQVDSKVHKVIFLENTVEAKGENHHQVQMKN
jgi:hypothetical protein